MGIENKFSDHGIQAYNKNSMLRDQHLVSPDTNTDMSDVTQNAPYIKESDIAISSLFPELQPWEHPDPAFAWGAHDEDEPRY